MDRFIFKSFFFRFLFVTCCCDYLCRVGMVLGIPGISGVACSPLRASSVYEGEGISLFRAGQAWMRTRDGRFFLGSRPLAGCLHRAGTSHCSIQAAGHTRLETQGWWNIGSLLWADRSTFQGVLVESVDSNQ